MTQGPFGVKDLLQADPMAADALEHKATIDYRSEIIRKGIHLCSLAIPVIYYFVSQLQALVLLVPVTVAFFVTDVARLFIEPVARWYYRWFGILLRKHEQDMTERRLNGATNILLSAVVCVLFFPKAITVNAFAILIISDTTSALIGRRFGKHRLFAKSLEGTAGFFLSAVLVVLFAPKVTGATGEYLLWIAGAAVGAVVEASSIKGIDDNITVPLAISLVMWALYLLFLPGADLNTMM